MTTTLTLEAETSPQVTKESIGEAARKEIEAAAETVLLSNTAYFKWQGDVVSHITVANGFVKPEGEPIQGWADSLSGVAKDKFVREILKMRGDNDVLIWRRRPSVEEWEGRFQINARFSWVKH